MKDSAQVKIIHKQDVGLPPLVINNSLLSKSRELKQKKKLKKPSKGMTFKKWRDDQKEKAF